MRRLGVVVCIVGAFGGCGGSSARDASQGDGGAPPDVAANLGTCPAYVPGTDLSVCTASYLGGAMTDVASGVAIGSDGSVFVAGSFPGVDFGMTPVTLLAGTTGAIIRLSPNGRTVLSVTRVGAAITDIDVHETSGRLVVAGDFGVAVLDPTATQVVWAHTLSTAGVRAAVGTDGMVAVLTTGHQVEVFEADGIWRSTTTLADQNTLDVAIDSASQHFFVAGWNQKNVAGACEGQLQVAFLRGYGWDSSVAWQDYDWSAVQANAMSLCADTRGLVVAMGADGKLYFAGHSAGGNAIYNQDPQQMAAPAANVATDMYNTAYDTSSNHITWYGRFDPANGALQSGQFLLTRLPSGAGNTIEPRAIAADTAGHVFVGGVSAYGIENGATLQISGMPLGAYSGGNWVLISSPDLRTRLTWTAFTGTGTGESNGLAVGHGAVALVGDQAATSMGSLLTVDALQPVPAGDGDGFVAVWRAP